jgi:hypothetical protein
VLGTVSLTINLVICWIVQAQHPNKEEEEAHLSLLFGTKEEEDKTGRDCHTDLILVLHFALFATLVSKRWTRQTHSSAMSTCLFLPYLVIALFE